jgi:hypothetical protein
VEFGIELIDRFRDLPNDRFVAIGALHEIRHLRPIDLDVDELALGNPEIALALEAMLGRKFVGFDLLDQDVGQRRLDFEDAVGADQRIRAAARSCRCG